MQRSKVNNTTGRTCGECLRGTYSQKHINKNTNGQPFLKICEFSEYATNAAGQHICLNTTAACKNFINNEKQND